MQKHYRPSPRASPIRWDEVILSLSGNKSPKGERSKVCKKAPLSLGERCGVGGGQLHRYDSDCARPRTTICLAVSVLAKAEVTIPSTFDPRGVRLAEDFAKAEFGCGFAGLDCIANATKLCPL